MINPKSKMAREIKDWIQKQCDFEKFDKVFKSTTAGDFKYLDRFFCPSTIPPNAFVATSGRRLFEVKVSECDPKTYPHEGKLKPYGHTAAECVRAFDDNRKFYNYNPQGDDARTVVEKWGGKQRKIPQDCSFEFKGKLPSPEDFEGALTELGFVRQPGCTWPCDGCYFMERGDPQPHDEMGVSVVLCPEDECITIGWIVD